MRRWNGWGDVEITYPLADSAVCYLAAAIGSGAVMPDATLEEVLVTIPENRLPVHPLIHITPFERLTHARGQSFPDWIALRSGHIYTFPAGVAYPTCVEDVRSLIAYAQEIGACLIPYGGGTSVVGHINPQLESPPAITIDLRQMNQLIELDETSRLASFGAGVSGPDLEKQLNQRGYTLGHFPQSFEQSTLGGWIATRSAGQQSYYYGRIEDLFAGGHVETTSGVLGLPCYPASAAGPDLRQMVLGSEGRLGVITHATVRVRAYPECECFYGIFFRNWEAGTTAVREIAQERLPVSMLRLSDAQETETTLVLSGKDQLVLWAERGLNWLGYPEGRCLLVMGITGNRRTHGFVYQQASRILRAHGGLPTGQRIGRIWQKSRFLTPYLRNSLWEFGYATDTLETALPWSKVLTTANATKNVLQSGLAHLGERVLVLTHLSHVYRDGASFYITFIYRRTADPEETLQRWQHLKATASQVIVANGGTISHQHGVGLDHAPYLTSEKGQSGMALLTACIHSLDPQGLFNPGKLLQD